MAAIGQFVQVNLVGQQLPLAVPGPDPAVYGSSAATTTVTGADSFTAGGLSRASAIQRCADTQSCR